MIEAAGYSFDNGGASTTDRKARRHINAAADRIFGCDDAGVAKMLSMLRGWVANFGKVPGNGIAKLATTNNDTVFHDVFVMYEASVKVAMHSSMRTVSVDAAHCG